MGDIIAPTTDRDIDRGGDRDIGRSSPGIHCNCGACRSSNRICRSGGGSHRSDDKRIRNQHRHRYQVGTHCLETGVAGIRRVRHGIRCHLGVATRPGPLRRPTGISEFLVRCECWGHRQTRRSMPRTGRHKLEPRVTWLPSTYESSSSTPCAADISSGSGKLPIQSTPVRILPYNAQR